MNKVLIVDDNPDCLECIELVLRNAGFDLYTTLHPLEALRVIPEFLPDLIITDFSMPVMTGLEFIEAAQKISKADYIIISGNCPTINIPNKDIPVLEKPFDPSQLIEMVNKYLSVKVV